MDSVGLQIWGSTVRITVTADNLFSFIVKFPKYFQTFNYILAKLFYVCIFNQSDKCMHIRV